MEVTVLPKDINERFQSDTRINNFTQCILELVFNSLDAKATSIAIRVNIAKHQVQVIDNGQGIILNDLHNVGIRYMTSKCESLHMYENKHKFYGYKGEALASIICVSEHFIITTRSETDELTYTKTFEHNSLINIAPSKTRSSKGTTVIVKKLFINCPVKQKRISSNIDLNNIKVLLQSLAVIHPHVSFSLRDDTTGKIILNCYKMKTVSESFCALFGGISCKDLIDVKVSKGNIHVSGLIYMKSYKNCKPQLIYVNKRPVNINVIAKYVKETLTQILNDINESYPIFVVNISCPYSEIDILYDPSNILIEFKSYEVVLKCVKKMMNLFKNKCVKINSQKQVLNNYKIHNDVKENEVEISVAKGEPEIVRLDEVKIGELSSNVKSQQNIVARKRSEQTSVNSKGRIKRYKKSLGLRKEKFALKKKKRNIFEKSADLSILSCQDFPPNMPLKRKKLENGLYCLKDMIDEHLDSQNSFFSKKPIFQNCLAEKELGFEDATTGKEFVMDLFLKSLTAPDSQHHLQVEPEDVCQNEDPMDNIIPSQNTILSIKTYSSDRNLRNDKNEVHETKMTKRQRMEKLNRMGTSLIENKLLQLNGININDGRQMKTDSLAITKRSKSVSTSPSGERSTLKRTLSENKSVQTSFLEKDTPKVESIGVQVSFHIRQDLKLAVENNTYEECPKNDTKNTTHFNLFHPTPHHFNFENNIQDINIFQSNQDNRNSNNMTFVSHYNLKLREQCCKTQKTPLTEVNTKDALANLSTMLFKRINKVDNRCKVFGNVLGKKATNGTYESPIEDLTFNLDYGNTSKFFAMKSSEVNQKYIKNDKNTWKNQHNLSILLNTSGFFEKRENEEINTENIKFNNLQNSASYNEDCNQTTTSFRHFIPPIQSTQKEAKYDGKFHDFFESLFFEDYKRMDALEISNIDNSIIQNVCEQVNSDNSKNCINEEIQDSVGNIYCTNKKTGTSTKNYLCGEPNFLLKKRTDFIPKGLSPILKEINYVNISLSPSSKKKLNNAIIETYENELELIKWQEYIDKQDPGQFFDTLYRAKNQQIEQSIPNVCVFCPKMVKKVFPLNTTYSFTKDIFTKLNVLGQLDNKFIVALHNFTLIILLDQHAVHERIRVEKLLNDYTLQSGNNDRILFKSVQCNEPFIINYTNTEIQVLKSFRLHFEAIGLFFKVYDTFIKIMKVPLCLANKCARNTNTEETLSKFTNNLINDELYVLQGTRGISSNIPKIIQYAINNEACRGAVKFGQRLTYDECCKYLTDLSKCQLPFQCAHGRPTLYPILEICCSNEMNLNYNLSRLRQIC